MSADAADLAGAVSVAEALAMPVDRIVTVSAFLCEDQSRVECPPCPEGADCAACLPRSWVFCDNPAVFDAVRSLYVIDPPSDYTLTVGHRYLLRGRKRDERELRLDELRAVE